MDLPNLFSAQKDNDVPSKVIGILLSQTKVQTVLLFVGSDGLSVEASSDIIEYSDPKSCVLQTDECLQQLPQESEAIDKVVFGLDHEWVKDGEIVDQYKPLLHTLSEDLALKPVGFIDTAEALAQHFIAHNSLYSGIFVLFSTTALTVSYVSQGKVKGIEQVGRSDSVVADLREGLARFSKQVEDEQFYLPAKLTLASFDLTEPELNELQQELLDFSWTEHARFLQMPTIQVINDEQFTSIAAQSAARAAAIAAGFYNAAATAPSGIVSSEDAEATSKELGFTELDTNAEAIEDEGELPPPTAFQPETPPIPASPPITAEPITAEPVSQGIEEDDNLTAVSSSVATSFGIPIASDKLVDSSKTLEELDREASASEPTDAADLSGNFLSRLRARWHEPYMGNRSLKFFILMGFASGLIVIAIALTGLVYATAQASIDVYVESIDIAKDISVTLDPKAVNADAEKMILPANIVTKTVSGESEVATTGVKIVGDKAKGKVTIYNKTTARKTFASGTKLKHGDLEFTLDDEVTIASASVESKSNEEQTIKSGKADASITASDIGADYNIGEGSDMAVADFADDTYSAEVTKAGTTGGASREVRIVSDEDRANLLAALRESLVEKINMEFREESGNGVYIMETSDITNEKATFSAEAEEEANEVSLGLSVTAEALSYNTDDLRPIAMAVLASEIPDNYELSDEDTNIMSTAADQDESGKASLALEARLSSKARPVMEANLVAEEIAGKSFEEAIRILENKAEIESVKINLQPKFAEWIRKSVPKADKITVHFRSE